MKLFCLTIFFLHNLNSFSQKNIGFYLQEYDIKIYPKKLNCSDTLTAELKNKIILKLYVKDCMGAMKVICFKGEVKISEGEYCNSLDSLKKYVLNLKAHGGEKEISVSTYFQPLRDGLWIYYNNAGRIKYSEYYKKGILQGK